MMYFPFAFLKSFTIQVDDVFLILQICANVRQFGFELLNIRK